ncbi:MAG: hypothetical protein U5K31_09820 [Balneolaceae bacterium]|nr:hypothetical protein [Balneolaceae bacterium]
MSGLSAFEEIHQSNERIDNRDSYEPLASGELTRSQVERFVAVQRAIHEQMEQRLTRFEEKYRQVSEEWEQRQPGYREALQVWTDLGKLYAEVKTIQVDALNAQDFSLEEYHYVRRSFYQSMGLGLVSYNLDAIAEAASEGSMGTDFENYRSEWSELPDETLEKNRELVSEYTDQAEEWLVFAWWGL